MSPPLTNEFTGPRREGHGVVPGEYRIDVARRGERPEPLRDAHLSGRALLLERLIIAIEVDPAVLRLDARGGGRGPPVEEVVVGYLREVHAVDRAEVMPEVEAGVDLERDELALARIPD